MSDKNSSVTVPRTISIMLFVMAVVMFGARMFAGLDISPVFPLGLVTVGIALMVVAQSNVTRG